MTFLVGPTRFIAKLLILIVALGFTPVHSQQRDLDSEKVKAVPRDVKNIKAYKKYAGASDITETVEFVSYDPAMNIQILDGSYKETPEAIVKGALLLPKRSEPVPVVILTPDSGGPGSFYSRWNKPFWKRTTSAMLKQGIGILILDGFATRGIDKTYDDQSRYFPAAQILDTLLAFKTLTSDPRIDSKRIGISGHSRGATTTFAVLEKRLTDAVLGDDQYFAAALPMAAPCQHNLFINPKPTPSKILVFHGLADDYTPASPCIEHAERMKAAGADIKLVLKKGWHHSFYGDFQPNACTNCVYMYKCPFDFLLADDGHLNQKFQKYLNSINEDYETLLATGIKGEKWIRVYRKIFPKCGSMGVTIGGGHWRESADIVSKFFVETLLPKN